MKRVTFYLDDEEYRQLKIVLAVHGMSASEWLRHQIAHYVRGAMPDIPLNRFKAIPPGRYPNQNPARPDDFNEDIDLK